MLKTDFTTIEYLKFGNKRQQQAFWQLTELSVFEKLKAYQPILTGTIPIGIDLPDSDLDIICRCEDHADFAKVLKGQFADQQAFKLKTKVWQGLQSTIATFRGTDFEIEIFGQTRPSLEQNAYRHMVKEAEILMLKGEEFKAEIIKLKQQGIKTEPAFARLLGLTGDPYVELLKVKSSVLKQNTKLD